MTNRFAVSLVIAALLGTDCYGARVWARKMEIVRTGSTYATVLRDSVVLVDEQSQLNCRWAVLDRDVAKARDSVVITTPDGVLYADSATYDLRAKTAELLGRVTVIRESLVITAPQLFYTVAQKQVRAGDGLVLENEGRSYRLTGKSGFYDLSRQIGIVDSAPTLIWVSSGDTVQATGRQMMWSQTAALVTAEGGVSVLSGKGELICDTALFYADADSGVAWGSPEVRDARGRASGDTMVFNVRQGSLEAVAVHGSAEGVYATDAGDVVDVRGDRFRLRLDRGDISRIEVDRITSGRLLRTARIRR